MKQSGPRRATIVDEQNDGLHRLTGRLRAAAGTGPA